MGAPEAINAMRRIVPPGYEVAFLEIEGTAPLLMSNGTVDRETEQYQTYAMLAREKRKSLDDEATLRKIEWELRIYLDADIGPYIPGKNIHELLRSAATKWKLGEDVKRSLVVVDERIGLIYEGPRTQDELWARGYRYTAMVSNSGPHAGKVTRCRPLFKQWSLRAEIAYDPEDLDFHALEQVAERSQKYGLGDYRPTFGSFRAKLQWSHKIKPEARSDATKPRDATQSAAHRASVERIKATA